MTNKEKQLKEVKNLLESFSEERFVALTENMVEKFSNGLLFTELTEEELFEAVKDVAKKKRKIEDLPYHLKKPMKRLKYDLRQKEGLSKSSVDAIEDEILNSPNGINDADNIIRYTKKYKRTTDGKLIPVRSKEEKELANAKSRKSGERVQIKEDDEARLKELEKEREELNNEWDRLDNSGYDTSRFHKEMDIVDKEIEGLRVKINQKKQAGLKKDLKSVGNLGNNAKHLKEENDFENIENTAEKTQMLNNLREDLQDELSAIKNYDAHADIAESLGFFDVAAVLRDIRDEEKVHCGELISLLNKHDSQFEASIEDGEKEVAEEINESIFQSKEEKEIKQNEKAAEEAHDLTLTKRIQDNDAGWNINNFNTPAEIGRETKRLYNEKVELLKGKDAPAEMISEVDHKLNLLNAKMKKVSQEEAKEQKELIKETIEFADDLSALYGQVWPRQNGRNN